MLFQNGYCPRYESARDVEDSGSGWGNDVGSNELRGHDGDVGSNCNVMSNKVTPDPYRVLT